MGKTDDAKNILKDFGLPENSCNSLSTFTFLALCNIKESDKWENASNSTLTVDKGILTFINDQYNQNYKTGSRESIRDVLQNFLDYNIIIKNKDKPERDKRSPKTNYAISDFALETIKKYNSKEWSIFLSKFKSQQFLIDNSSPEKVILRKITIKNFKSILDDSFELGRINIFIGSNGSGKSNILESLALVGAAKDDALDIEGLFSRGIRVAKPSLTFSSFLSVKQSNKIEILLNFEENQRNKEIKSVFTCQSPNDFYSKWYEEYNSEYLDTFNKYRDQFLNEKDDKKRLQTFIEFLNLIQTTLALKGKTESPNTSKYSKKLAEFLIYSPDTLTLRGFTSQSKKTPLGIHGESLDILISSFSLLEQKKLKDLLCVFDWLDDYVIDKENSKKYEGHKLGRSNSLLYFTDKFMQKQNNIFSSENVNEGILHVLFYFALFISTKTPTLFAIDNIETALNPRLCRMLIKEICKLAKQSNKQVLITTHNPAVLDGMNLFDDEQRLFEVYRTSEGFTKTRRIMFKKGLENKEFKLSEMWMKGLIGAIPTGF